MKSQLVSQFMSGRNERHHCSYVLCVGVENELFLAGEYGNSGEWGRDVSLLSRALVTAVCKLRHVHIYNVGARGLCARNAHQSEGSVHS